MRERSQKERHRSTNGAKEISAKEEGLGKKAVTELCKAQTSLS